MQSVGGIFEREIRSSEWAHGSLKHLVREKGSSWMSFRLPQVIEASVNKIPFFTFKVGGVPELPMWWMKTQVSFLLVTFISSCEPGNKVGFISAYLFCVKVFLLLLLQC